MNYEKSQQILEEIKKANSILLNCHRGPDPDGIGSTIAMKVVLEGMNKVVDIICPSRVISKQTDFLTGYNDIKLGVNFDSYDFSKYDLFITLDTPNLSLLTGKENSKVPDVKTIVIDHHFISTLPGFIELKDEKATSVGEMLYLIFKDWNIVVDKNIAECLVTSIVGDTGAFAYPNTTSQTLRIVAELMDLGVDKDMIVNKIYRNEDFQMIKFWCEVLSRMQMDEEHHFIYSMIPYEIYKDFSGLDDAKAKAASLFAPIVTGTDFGFIGVEESPKFITVSFRGRTNFDTSKVAKELGGGGHKISSAVKFEGMSFEEVTEKVLAVARKYANKK
jgi:bifunctional oligoribonuclease and PAP phosphatase NrnA